LKTDVLLKSITEKNQGFAIRVPTKRDVEISYFMSWIIFEEDITLRKRFQSERG